MNKKMIMLISMLFCVNNMIFTSQRDIIVSLTTTGLSAPDNKIYQILISKYQSKELTADDNTLSNLVILNTKEAFLKSQVAQKPSLWPSWLLTAFVTLPYTAKGVIWLMKPVNYAQRIQSRWSGWTQEPDIVRYHRLIDSPLGRFFDIELEQTLKYAQEEFGIPFPALIYIVAPLLAFYALYRKYNSLQSQQQELEMVMNIRAQLKSFGEPSI